jgi:ABC-type transport system involved in multi-copper enzyme maturation permease subunit
MFFKEWKERLPFFLLALAALFVFAVLFLGLSGKRDAVDFLTGAATLVFLPVLGLLLGASAFNSEFKDGAWAYLLSRPVKKWQIWLVKYVSLLSVLLAVMVVFSVIVEIVPGVKDVLADLSFTLRLGRKFSLFSLGLVWSLALFNTAFSLAFLSEKQYAIIFLTLLLWAFLYSAFVLVYSSPLQIWLYRILVPWALSTLALFSLGLALASLLTFGRADFSQPKKKAWHFTKLATVFVAVSFVISAGIMAAFSRAGGLSRISDLKISGRAAFFHTGKGIYRYDLASRRLKRIHKTFMLWSSLSVGGDKVVFVKYTLESRNRMSTDLWIIDADGQNARPLIETSREGGPFYNLLIWEAEIAPDGRTVAFLTRDDRDQHTFYWMNSDGSGIRSLSLQMPQTRYFHLVGFSGSAENVLLQCVPQVRTAESGASLLWIDLNQATVEPPASNVRKPYLAAFSRQDLAAYIAFDEIRGQEVLLLHDLQTGDKRQVLAADSIVAFSWTEGGDKLAVWTGKTNLSIYSLAEKRVVGERDMKGYDIGPLLALNWGPGDTRLILCRSEQGKRSICVLDEELNEVKAVPLPWMTGDGLRLDAAGKVIFAWQYDKRELWTVDLETEKWRKVY